MSKDIVKSKQRETIVSNSTNKDCFILGNDKGG